MAKNGEKIGIRQLINQNKVWSSILSFMKEILNTILEMDRAIMKLARPLKRIIGMRN